VGLAPTWQSEATIRGPSTLIRRRGSTVPPRRGGTLGQKVQNVLMTYGTTTGEYGLATLCEPVQFVQGQVGDGGLPCSDGVERRARRQYIALLSEAAVTEIACLLSSMGLVQLSRCSIPFLGHWGSRHRRADDEDWVQIDPVLLVEARFGGAGQASEWKAVVVAGRAATMKVVRVFECETTGCKDSRGVVAKPWLREWLRVRAVIISVDRGGLRRGFRSRDRQSSEGGRGQLSRNAATSSTRAICIVTRVLQRTDDDVICRYAADGSWYGSRYHYSSSCSSSCSTVQLYVGSGTGSCSIAVLEVSTANYVCQRCDYAREAVR
jgi:hypothetical protein